jgi:hypothetical protein
VFEDVEISISKLQSKSFIGHTKVEPWYILITLELPSFIFPSAGVICVSEVGLYILKSAIIL